MNDESKSRPPLRRCRMIGCEEPPTVAVEVHRKGDPTGYRVYLCEAHGGGIWSLCERLGSEGAIHPLDKGENTR